MSDYRTHALSPDSRALVCDGGLAGLPPDVLFRITGYLHPLDIIVLRMVRDVSLNQKAAPSDFEVSPGVQIPSRRDASAHRLV